MNPTSNTPNSFETSFLPQQPVSRGASPIHRKEPIAIGMIIALVVFFITLSAAGGILLYKKNLERRIANEKGELASKEAGIDMVEIAKLEVVSRHLVAAEKILYNHAAFSLVLDLLAQGTAVNIGYSQLSFTGGEQAPSIQLSGVAPSYSAVYFQGEAMRARPYVANSRIASVALDSRTGTVSFTMQVDLKQDALRYGRYFEANSAPVVPVSSAAEAVKPPAP